MVLVMTARKNNAGMKVLVFFLITMIIINLAFIWVNSAKVSTESNKSSNRIAKVVAEKTVKDFETLPKSEQQKHIKKANSSVRSMAHFAEFIPLGFLVYLLLLSLLYCDDYRRLCLACALFALIICALCALGDEVHQIFVKGRSFEVKDILIDSLGSALGVAISAIAYVVVCRVRKRKHMK